MAEAQSDSEATQSQPDKPSSSRKGGRSRTAKAWSIDQFAVPEVEGKVRFHDLDLPTELMRAIADLGFEYCSSIQAEVLPHTLDGLRRSPVRRKPVLEKPLLFYWRR